MSSTRPATYVPEDLISQAQSVLQGRSRNLIIRELQRTNLDVNLAVNNLLSRDEEDGDDADDGSQDNYVPEDLISLLDAGINADHPSVIIDADAMFSEDMFGYSQRRSSSSNRNGIFVFRRSSVRSGDMDLPPPVEQRHDHHQRLASFPGHLWDKRNAVAARRQPALGVEPHRTRQLA